eukprot:280071_1
MTLALNNQQREVASSCLEYLLLAVVQQYKQLGDEYNWDTTMLHEKLKDIGEHLGIRLLEKLVKEHARFGRELDIIKFLCKDFWNHCFNKSQVDKLQTNHKGTYVIHDSYFPWIKKISSSNSIHSKQPVSSDEDPEKPKPHAMEIKLALLYLNITAGMIRGAIKNLGRKATVSVDIPTYPKCYFTIKMIKEPASNETDDNPTQSTPVTATNK